MKPQILQLSILISCMGFALNASAGAAAYADFQKACLKKLDGRKNKSDLCECLAANYKIKNLTDSQVATLTLSYTAKAKLPKDEQTLVLLNFDESVADLCLADPKKRIELDKDDDDSEEPKTSGKTSK